MRPASILLVLLLSVAPAAAQQRPTIGIAAPLSGPSAILGRQLAEGVAAAATDRATLIAADTECTGEGGAAAAREFVRTGVSAAVGFLCAAEIEGALPILAEASIPVVAVGVRANRLTDRRERTGHPVWRVAPRTDASARAIARFVQERWRSAPFGIVEDGSVHGRDLADEVRTLLAVERTEPALVDNYRPAEERQFALARRIGQSGVTRLLVFGDRTDVAILARDSAELDLALDIVGDESLLDEPGEVPLPAGVRAVAIDDQEGLFPETVGDRAPEGYFVPSFAAAEIALEALVRTESDGSSFAEAMTGAPFPTALGPIGFDGNGDSTRDPFRLLQWDGTRFAPVPEG